MAGHYRAAGQQCGCQEAASHPVEPAVVLPELCYRRLVRVRPTGTGWRVTLGMWPTELELVLASVPTLARGLEMELASALVTTSGLASAMAWVKQSGSELGPVSALAMAPG